MAARYRRQRAFEPLQPLLTAAPQLAIWDDHDYGPNDSDASYVLKGETLKLFQRYWPNPSYGLPDVPGTFGFARYGDVTSSCSTIATTARPTAAPDGPDKTMFGAAPARVAEAGADRSRRATASRSSPAAASSGTGPAASRAGTSSATEQQAFADWLAQQKIDGVIFLSGDRHFGELLRDRAARRLSAATNSRRARSRRGRRARLDQAERENPDLVPGHARSAAAVRADPRSAAPATTGAHRARKLRQPGRRGCGGTRFARATCASRAQGRTSLEPDRPRRRRGRGAGRE